MYRYIAVRRADGVGNVVIGGVTISSSLDGTLHPI